MDAPDITALADEFMDIIGFPEEYQTPENRHKLFKVFWAPDPAYLLSPANNGISQEYYVKDVAKTLLYQNLPVFPPDTLGELQRLGPEGKYGVITIHPLRPKKIYKFLSVKPGKRAIDVAFVAIKEALIQFILANDAERGRHVPKIFGIYKVTAGDREYIIVEMERSTFTLFELFGGTSVVENGQAKIAFLPGAILLAEALDTLEYFRNKYSFHHRDLKTDNIMIKRRPDGTGYSQLIDFGMSCMKISISDKQYTIKIGPEYAYSAKCTEQQYVTMLLMELYVNYDAYEQRFKAFLDAAIPAAIHPATPGTSMYARRGPKENGTLTLSPFGASYNRTGTYYSELPAEVQAELTVSALLAKLRAAIAEAEGGAAAATGGGRKRKSKKSKSRRTRRR
jgi:serine/threonine protein kinase